MDGIREPIKASFLHKLYHALCR